MTYEQAGFGLAIIAAILSIVAMWRTRKFNEATLIFNEATQEFNEKSLELNKALLRHEEIHAELSKRQLAQMDEQEIQKSKGDLVANFEKMADQLFKLHITNHGKGTVTDVQLAIPHTVKNNPLWEDDISELLPFPILHAGDSFFIKADAVLGIERSLPISLTWTNADGSKGEKTSKPSF